MRLLGRTGLYPIVDLTLCRARATDPIVLARALLDLPLFALQVRAKHEGAAAQYEVLKALAPTAESAGVPLFANDRADVAWAASADGVHVGQDDLSPAEVHALATQQGRGLMVGFSTHSEEQFLAGRSHPVDYVALGPVLVTGNKERPDPVLGLAQVKAMVGSAGRGGPPTVLIGGMDLESFREALPWVDAIACIGAVTPVASGPDALRAAMSHARMLCDVAASCVGQVHVERP